MVIIAKKKKEKANQVPLPFFCCAGVGDRELAEETGLARSAYMSSESALRTELLLEEALKETEVGPAPATAPRRLLPPGKHSSHSPSMLNTLKNKVPALSCSK